MSESKPTILVLTVVPPDLRMRLEQNYALVDRKALSEGADLSGFRVALTTSMAGADAAAMTAIPNLGLLACNGAGLDKIDLATAAQRGVAVANTSDELTEDTGDFAIGLLYAVSRRIVEADRFVRTGQWKNARMAPSRRIFGKTLGIVGLGKIGEAVARRATGIGMTVAYTGRSRKANAPYPFEPDLGRLAESADVLVLTCSGGAQTHHLINAAILKRLGGDGILINIARGSVVDEEALIQALTNGGIAAAGLDVFATEPAIDDRFMALENVVLQPHYACITHETRGAMIDRLDNDITSFLGGRPFRDAARP